MPAQLVKIFPSRSMKTLVGKPSDVYTKAATLCHTGFQRFWSEAASYCYDVLDTPDGNHDTALRPNQLLAVSLPLCLRGSILFTVYLPMNLLIMEQAAILNPQPAPTLLVPRFGTNRIASVPTARRPAAWQSRRPNRLRCAGYCAAAPQRYWPRRGCCPC